MNKNFIIAIVMILAILGVGVAIKYSQPKTEKTETSSTEEANPASQLGEGEFKFTEENFQKEVKEAKGIVLVDFYLPTCPHCKVAGPIVSEVAKETQGKYKVGKINAQLANNLSTEYKIEYVPALIFFKDGKEVARLTGEQKKEAILAKLEEVSK